MVVIQPLLRGVKKYAWIPFKQVLSVIFWPISVLFYPIKEFYFLMCFIAYVSFASLASISKAVVVFYTTCRIGVLLVMFLCVRALGHTNDFLIQLWRFLDGFLSDDHDVSKRIPIVRRAMAKARSWEEWRRLAQELDRLEKNEEWKAEPTSDLYDHELLTMQVERLKQPRSVSSSDGRKIMFGLQNVFHRKFCQLENSALYTSHLGTKYLIEEFYARTVEQLSYIAKTNFQRSAAVSSSSLPLTSPSPLPPPSQSPLPPAAAASLGSGADAGSNALFSGPPSTGLVSPLSISSPLAATPQQLVPSPSPSSSPSSDLSVVREHDEKEAHCTTTSSTDTDKHDAKNDGVGGEGERNTYSNQLLNNSANIHPQPLGASLSSSGEVRLTDKLRFFQRARKSYGKTVLCLSGGGALTMYHLGEYVYATWTYLYQFVYIYEVYMCLCLYLYLYLPPIYLSITIHHTRALTYSSMHKILTHNTQ